MTEIVSSPLRQFRIAGDKIAGAARNMPTQQAKADFLWFATYCREKDLGATDLGQILKKPNGTYYSGNSVAQFLTGLRAEKGENVTAILKAVADLRRVEEPRQEQISSPFIETRLFKEIERRCLKALKRQRILFLFGESQIGKTESLLEVKKRHNHGTTVYFEIPTGGGLTNLLKTMARHFGLPEQQNQDRLKEAVFKCIDDKMLLIFDEAHRCLESDTSRSGLRTLSFIREIWNRKKPGIVLSLTNEGRKQLLSGTHAKALQQLWKRRITPLQLPNFPPDDDAEKFAIAYGLPPAPDKEVKLLVTTYDDTGREVELRHKDSPLRLQRQVLSEEGLGVWIGILQDAADMAQESGREITWSAVLKAHCQSAAEAEIFK